MNKWTVCLFLIVGFLAGCTPPESESSSSTIETLSSTTPVGFFDTRISAYWAITPDIKICPGAGVSRDRVRSALSFWKNGGYEFRDIIEVPSTGEPCFALPGEIAFKVPSQKELAQMLADSRAGVTLTSHDRITRQIIMAEIYFQHQFASHKEKIVEHEIGHALGWKHHTQSSHIMHPRLEMAGLSRIGVERRDYEARINELLASLEEEWNER